MSDFPHGHKAHAGYLCGDCDIERVAAREKALTDQYNEAITVINGEHSTIVTNGGVGGWLKTSDGSYVSVEYAKSINREQRRKRGIKL